MELKEHIEFWVDSAENDLDTAGKLFESAKYDWCLFLGHLVLEKVLKACYIKDNNNQMPPRIHNLVKLAEKTLLNINEDQRMFLDEVIEFNLEVRYPEYKREFHKKCTKEFCEERLSKIKECFEWLKFQIKSEK